MIYIPCIYFLLSKKIPIATYDLNHLVGWTDFTSHAMVLMNYRDSGMSEEKIDRKITVIFATDVVGYSKHMEVDESETVKNLRACERLLAGLFKKYKARLFNTA